MAKCTLNDSDCFTVDFDSMEMETIGQHAKREKLMLVDALADLMEYVIGQKRCEICQEEHEAVSCQSEEARTVGLDLKYPKKGPLSLLTDDEKEYVMSCVMQGLGEGVQTVLLRHSSGGN